MTTSSDIDPRQWTTSPGRIPFDAAFYSESTSSVYIPQGSTITHWVKFRNIGGRTWTNTQDANGRGRFVLYSTDSAGTTTWASQFDATDWETTSLATPLDQASVAPDAIGTFTFGLFGNGLVGSYYPHNYFNIRVQSLYWMDWDPNWTYDLPIHIQAHCSGC
jgi:hypothetical protein